MTPDPITSGAGSSAKPSGTLDPASTGRASPSPDQVREPAPGTRLLRLIAMDDDDLSILSANLQDMQVPVREMIYLSDQKRFALVGKRFDWVKAFAGGCERCATGLHFECVLGVSRTGFAQTEIDRVLNLLAINFELTDVPGGTITLTFSDDAAIRLSVECLEAQMRDLGERWPCDCQPVHA